MSEDRPVVRAAADADAAALARFLPKDADPGTLFDLGLVAVVSDADGLPAGAGWLVPQAEGGLALGAAVPVGAPPGSLAAVTAFLLERTGEARVFPQPPVEPAGGTGGERFPPHAHGGARALVMLHETAFRDFLEAWTRFRAAGAALPETDDPDYASPEHLLHHVLRAGRGYLRWSAATLSLPDPRVVEPPRLADLPAAAGLFAEHLLLRWRTALVAATAPDFDLLVRPSNWGVPYCTDAMLEHAVMHPTRHAFQLRRRLPPA